MKEIEIQDLTVPTLADDSAPESVQILHISTAGTVLELIVTFTVPTPEDEETLDVRLAEDSAPEPVQILHIPIDQDETEGAVFEPRATSTITTSAVDDEEMLDITFDESYGPDNILVYDKVQTPAGYLIQFQSDQLYLTENEAACIVRLWNYLSDYDWKPTDFKPRCDADCNSRFRAPKKKRYWCTVHRNVCEIV